jgi:hypothetical protein
MAMRAGAESAWSRSDRRHRADAADDSERMSGQKRKHERAADDSERIYGQKHKHGQLRIDEHPRRPLFDKLINWPASEAEMNVQRAPRFIDAVITYPDKRELLHKLVDKQLYGEFRLREAVSISSGYEHFQSTILPLLRMLQCDELQKSSLRHSLLEVLMHLFHTPTLINELWQNAQCKDRYVNADICKFLISIVTASQDARKDRTVRELGEFLLELKTPGSEELMAVLKPPVGPANHLSNNTGTSVFTEHANSHC